MSIITRRYRTLLLSALLFCLMGCHAPVEPDNNPANTSGGGGSVSGNNNCTSAATCKQVTIATQTWMAENLNIVTADSWCYYNDDSYCAKYGRLYTWDAAVAACPSGWRLPDTSDWRKLIAATGDINNAGYVLKSRDWCPACNFKDVLGFSALPGGYGLGGSFATGGEKGYWWSATESNVNNGFAYAAYIFNDRKDVILLDPTKRLGYSVRCVAN